MSHLRRLVLVRHGETDGESSTRFHGANDVGLAPAGREHMRAVARALRGERFDRIVASPLRRAWQSAWILGGGAPIVLEPAFREVDFGRWEGLTREESATRDPVLHQEWERGAADFSYPGGEARADLRARVLAGLQRLVALDARSVMVVCHKGPIRIIAAELVGQSLPDDEPALGGVVELTRAAGGPWFFGRRSSNPAALTA